MARKEKAEIGRVACPVCGGNSSLRRMESRKPAASEAQAAESRKGGKVGALYVDCREADGRPRCGTVQGTGPEFQRRLAGVSAAPEPPARTAPDLPAAPVEPARPAPVRPVPVAASKPARGFFGFSQ